MSSQQIIVILLILTILFSLVTIVLNVSFGNGVSSVSNVPQGNVADNGSGQVSLTITLPGETG